MTHSLTSHGELAKICSAKVKGKNVKIYGKKKKKKKKKKWKKVKKC